MRNKQVHRRGPEQPKRLVLVRLSVARPLLAALLLALCAAPAAAQRSPSETGWVLVPFVGLGTRAGTGTEFHFGGTAEHLLSRDRVRLRASVSGWTAVVGCDASYSVQCPPSSGWTADAGAALLFLMAQSVRPYLGGALGIAHLRDLTGSASVFAGLELASASRISVRIEGRYQRAFEAEPPDIVSLHFGLGIRPTRGH